MTINDLLREKIIEGISPTAMKRLAIQEGVSSLRHSGIAKIIEGVTTSEEVLSNTISDTN